MVGCGGFMRKILEKDEILIEMGPISLQKKHIEREREREERLTGRE